MCWIGNPSQRTSTYKAQRLGANNKNCPLANNQKLTWHLFTRTLIMRGQLRWLAPILSHLPNFASYHWLWRSGVFKQLVVEEGGKLRGEIELINSAICPQVSTLTSICRDLGSTSTIYFPQSLSSSLVVIMRAWDAGVRNWCLKWLLKLHRYFLGLSCIDIIEMILSDSCT